MEQDVFTPTQGANPHDCEVVRKCRQEAKIEVIFPETKQEQVLAAMLQASYEEFRRMMFIPLKNQSKNLV